MKTSTKKLFDYFLFAGLCISLLISLVTMSLSGIVIQWQHYLAALFLIINGVIFYNSHKKGVLFSGLTITLGVIGFLAFQEGLVGASVYWTPGNWKIPIFAGNPILLIVLIVHMLISGPYYVGILTKEYWQHLGDENY